MRFQFCIYDSDLSAAFLATWDGVLGVLFVFWVAAEGNMEKGMEFGCMDGGVHRWR